MSQPAASKRVRDVMIPLHEYAVVPEDATLADAIKTLSETQRRLGVKRHPPRAVLVSNPQQQVIGQLELLDFLRALEPKYKLLGDLDRLARAGVSQEVIGSLINNMQLWQGELEEACARLHTIKVADVMRPISESMDDTTPLAEAVHRLVLWQTMRALVRSSGTVIGVVRVTDLVREIVAHISTEDHNER